MSDWKINQDQEQLFDAVARRDVTELRRLLDAGADPNFGHSSRAPSDSTTPLHRAALKGDGAAVALLLENGADPNAVLYRQLTPLDLTKDEGVRRRLVDAGGLTRWALMEREPVIGGTPVRRPDAAEAVLREFSFIPVEVGCDDGRTYTVEAEFRAGWFFLCFSPDRPYGDDKHALTEAQFRQLAAGQRITVDRFAVCPRGPLRHR